MKNINALLILMLMSAILSAADININSYYVKQYTASFTYTFPDTVVHEGDVIIIGRNCTQAEFEAFWGVTLGSNVIFFNSEDRLPKINGDETFSLHDSTGTLLDSTPVPQPPDGEVCIQRDSTNVDTWTVVASSMSDPGVYTHGGYNCGLKITEFTDTSGTGNYIYEFVELYNDINITGIDNFRETHSESVISYDISNSVLSVNDKTDEVKIYNIVGEEIYSSAYTGPVSVKHLNNGIYFVLCKDGKERYLKKLAIIK